jgi:Ni,Fe-hydrogenase I large subunit
MATYEVDPISRIEGHLGVKVTTGTGSAITEADAHGNLFRGFENFLIGRRANDAITFTQRICGVCPVPHGTAATFAADSVTGVSTGYATFSSDQYISGTSGPKYSDGVPEAALHVRNIVLASEFLMSSITHFYHLVAQSYVQGPPIPPWTPYFKDGHYHSLLKHAGKTLPSQNAGTKAQGDAHALLVADWNAGYSNDLWSAVITQYVKALRIRRLCLEAGALFAGRMPMMSNSVAGGTTNTFHNRADFDAKLAAYRTMMEEVGTFVVREYIPLAIALGALYPDFDNANNTLGHPELSTNATAGTGRGFGAGLGNFLSWGAFPQAGGTMALKGAVVVDAAGAATTTKLLENRAGLITDEGSLLWAKDKVEHNLKEFISRSRYENTHGYSAGVDSAYPGSVTMTEPKRDGGSTKYSWMKAPRWDSYAMEVGPLARMTINGFYPVTNLNIVGGNYGGGIGAAYASIYGDAGGLNGVDLRVLDRDLVSGLVGGGDLAVADAVTKWVAGCKGGLSTMDRLRARAIESYWMIRFLLGAPSKDAGTGAISFPSGSAVSGNGWVGDLKRLGGADAPNFYRSISTPPLDTISGYGLVEAPRGALGHFITATGGKINSYQCVVPTTWNGSPKNGTAADSAAYEAKKHLNDGPNRGAIEQAMIDVVFDGAAMDGTNHQTAGAISGVEVLRVAQSFDPCIACAVH